MSDEEIRAAERAGDVGRLEVLAARVGDERRLFALRHARGVCPMCQGAQGLGPSHVGGEPRECCCGQCYEDRRGPLGRDGMADGHGVWSGRVVSCWSYLLCNHCPHIEAVRAEQEAAETRVRAGGA